MYENPTQPHTPPAERRWTVAERHQSAVVPGLQTKTFVDSRGYCKAAKAPAVETSAQIHTILPAGEAPIFTGLFLNVTVRNAASGTAVMGHSAITELPNTNIRASGIVREPGFWSRPLSTDPTDTLEAMWQRVLAVVSQRALVEQKVDRSDLSPRLSALLQEQAARFALVLSGEIKARTQLA